MALGIVAPPPGLAPRDNSTSWAVRRMARDAEAGMRTASQVIREAKQRAGVETAAGEDASGLLGAEWSPLATTLGQLEAKQIATSPAWARVLVEQFHAAGIRRNDIVAASFSGSFPGFNLAIVMATRAIGARLIAISSVTGSTWGAIQPGFTWPEMEVQLVRSGLITPVSVGVSAGGEGDRALDLEPDGRQMAERIAAQTASELGAQLVRPSSFDEAVRGRRALLEQCAAGRQISVYVNVGGTQASLGRSPSVLRLKSGWLAQAPFDASPDRGLMADMAARGIRVLHMLNVRDLAVRWGII